MRIAPRTITQSKVCGNGYFITRIVDTMTMEMSSRFLTDCMISLKHTSIIKAKLDERTP